MHVVAARGAVHAASMLECTRGRKAAASTCSPRSVWDDDLRRDTLWSVGLNSRACLAGLLGLTGSRSVNFRAMASFTDTKETQVCGLVPMWGAN